MALPFSSFAFALSNVDWASLPRTNPTLFYSVLYFFLFFLVAWLALRSRFPGRPGRFLCVVLAVLLTTGLLYVEGQAGFSPGYFGWAAVLLLGLVLVLLFVRVFAALRWSGSGRVGGGGDALGGSGVMGRVFDEFGVLKDRVSALVKRSEESEGSVLKALEGLREDLKTAPDRVAVKRRALRRLAWLLRLQCALDRRLGVLRRFFVGLERGDVAILEKWKKNLASLPQTQKIRLLRAMQGQWKRVSAEDRVGTLSRKLRLCGARLEALARRAAALLERDDEAGLQKVLGEAVSQAKTMRGLYRRVKALEDRLVRQTEKLLRQFGKP